MSAAQAEKARRFQALHAQGCFVLPNAWDAGSTRLLASLGYAAIATTSAGLAFSLGRRDGERAVAAAEALANAEAIVAATDLPVTADLEDGYALHPDGLAETIAAAAAAGLVGASIEDASYDFAAPIRPLAEARERVAAAVAAARALPWPFTVTARAENFLCGRPDLADTLARLKAYAEAGADVVYAPALPDLAAVRAVCAATDRPVNVLASGPLLKHSVGDLAAAGARRISIGGGFYRAAVGALLRAGREIAADGTFTALADATSFAEISALMPPRQP